ncbi:lysine transporter LysE [Streptomyces coelicoflavus]|uniref:lysine transporter LysE n=1 Tax=Streptomyces coelicoflavus TaxID=285562 RepID=UPI00210D8290|nr:lysine transporter LysE [Streptomyces coelicoflavus]MCQ4201625.1 lysine transporter LysE [Streptomyces coelicoflavus]
MGVRRAARGVGEFLVGTVGEAVTEAVLSLLLAHGAWRTFRAPPSGSRRGLAGLTVTVFGAAAATALFPLLYATDCDCL